MDRRKLTERMERLQTVMETGSNARSDSDDEDVMDVMDCKDYMTLEELMMRRQSASEQSWHRGNDTEGTDEKGYDVCKTEDRYANLTMEVGTGRVEFPKCILGQ